MDNLAVDDDEPARQRHALAAQRQARKDQVRGRRSDVDADGVERDPLRAPHRMVFIHCAFVFFVEILVMSLMQFQFLRFQVLHARAIILSR